MVAAMPLSWAWFMNKAAVPCGRPSCMNTQESSLAAKWKPATSLWAVSERLKYNQPLNPGDPLWVNARQAPLD